MGLVSSGTLNRGRNLCVTDAIVVEEFHGLSGIERGKGVFLPVESKRAVLRGDQ